jgi:hypothetical protein
LISLNNQEEVEQADDLFLEELHPLQKIAQSLFL